MQHKYLNSSRWIYVAAGVLWAAVAFGQSHKAHYKYRGLVQGGPILGSYGASYQAQTVQGLAAKQWFTGLVAAYDNYRMPGMLLGLHGSYAVGHQKLQPYLLAQAGPFLPVRKGMWAAKTWDNQGYIIDLKTGWFAQGGAGISLPLGQKGQRLHLNAMYSIKHGVYRENSWWGGPVPGPGPWLPMVPSDIRQRLNMNRLVIQAGISW